MMRTIGMLAISVALLAASQPADAWLLRAAKELIWPTPMGDGTLDAYCRDLASGGNDAGLTVFLMEKAGC